MLCLRFMYLGLCLSLSPCIIAFDNPLKVPLEVLKATGIAQKELKYSNDIEYLIRNGHKWAFIMALALKYGYNPIEEKPFTTLNPVDPLETANDFFSYYTTIQITKDRLINESKKTQSRDHEMIFDGTVQVVSSALGYKIIKIFTPSQLKPLALICALYVGCSGAKKIYDGSSYQDHIAKRIRNNEFMKEALDRATGQVKDNATLNASKTLETIWGNIKKKIFS